jgi:hypothetical protein
MNCALFEKSLDNGDDDVAAMRRPVFGPSRQPGQLRAA